MLETTVPSATKFPAMSQQKWSVIARNFAQVRRKRLQQPRLHLYGIIRRRGFDQNCRHVDFLIVSYARDSSKWDAGEQGAAVRCMLFSQSWRRIDCAVGRRGRRNHGAARGADAGESRRRYADHEGRRVGIEHALCTGRNRRRHGRRRRCGTAWAGHHPCGRWPGV